MSKSLDVTLPLHVNAEKHKKPLTPSTTNPPIKLPPKLGRTLPALLRSYPGSQSFSRLPVNLPSPALSPFSAAAASAGKSAGEAASLPEAGGLDQRRNTLPKSNFSPLSNAKSLLDKGRCTFRGPRR